MSYTNHKYIKTIRRIGMSFFSYLLFFFMLLKNESVKTAALDALLRWFYVMIPTLFPFFIVSRFIMNSKPDSLRIFSRAYHLSNVSAFTLLIGFVCGCPVSAKCISELIKTGQISMMEGTFLAGLTSNISPAFIIGAAFSDKIYPPWTGLFSWLLLCVSTLISGYYCRKTYSFPIYEQRFDRSSLSDPVTNQLDEGIQSACEGILKVGGYMIVFQVLIQLCQHLFPALVLLFFEITYGITKLASYQLSPFLRYLLSMNLLAFGGVCALFQVYGMLREHHISLLPIIKQKLITMTVTSFLILIIYPFFV